MSNTLPPGPLAYDGIRAIPYITKTFAPTTSNYQFDVPTIWANTSAGDAYILVAKPGSVANWVLMASNTGDISAIDTPDGNTVVGTLGVVDFLNGTGMSITGSASNVTFNSTGGGYTWNNVTGTTQAVAISNAYLANNSSLVTFTLPSTAVFGSSFIISGYGSGGWTLHQNALQSVVFGGANTSTTVGITGSISSTVRSNSLVAVCVVANTTFKIIQSMGNLTIV